MAFAPPLSNAGILTRKLSSSFYSAHTFRSTTRPQAPAPHKRHAVMASAIDPDTKIGFIGLGVMGLPMAANLAKTFNNLVVWNRSDKSATLADAIASTGASIHTAAQPADVVRECEYTFSMLSTPTAVQNVFFDHDGAALQAVTAGKKIIDCSTLRVEDMCNTNQKVVENGGQFLEAPVSGSKGPAEQGQLIFLGAGDQSIYDDPITQQAFQLMGKRSFYFGEVGNATRLKLVINQLMATMLAALGESIVLTEALDLSATDLLEVLSLGAMNNPMFSLKGPTMLKDVKNYQPNFPLEHAEKDVRFAQMLAEKCDVKMDVSKAAYDLFKTGKDLGLNRQDFAAVVETLRS